MRKNTGKVLSMILAMAMVVSSFSATFVSASTQEVVGTDARVNTVDSGASDDYDVVSDRYEDLTLIEDLDDAYEVQTLDREDLDDVEYVSFTKVSGDSLVKVQRQDDDTKDLVLKKNASGTETIRINYKGTYTDDETDREVTARGSIEVDITANVEGTIVLAPVGSYSETPDDVELAAVNDSGFELALYMARHEEGETPSPVGNWELVKAYQDEDFDSVEGDADYYTNGYFDISSDKNFTKSQDEVNEDISRAEDEAAEDETPGDVINPSDEITRYDADERIFYFGLKHEDEEGGNYYAKTFSTRLEVYAPKVSFDTDGARTPDWDETEKGDRIRVDIGVGRKWRQNGSTEISKLGARTLVSLYGSQNFEDEKYSDIEDDAKIVTGFEIIMDSGSLNVSGGSLESIEGAETVTIENANISGDVKASGSITVGEGARVGGAVKDADQVEIQDGATVGSVDNDSSANENTVTLDGAVVSGNITTDVFTANDNDEYNNSVDGDIKADEFTVEAIDGSFNVDGAMIAASDTAEYTFEGDNIAIGSIDGDYYNPSVTFDDSTVTLAVTNMNSFNTTVVLTNESDVTINGSARLGSVEVEEDSFLRFTADATIDELSGDGMVVAQAGQFHIKGGMADVSLKLNGLAIGSTAFTADTDAVDEYDFNAVGYSLVKEAASSTVDRFVVDAVSFAGLAFDKEFVTIAQGYSDTITLAAYPTGTNAPADARVMWELDGNDDAFNVVVDPNTNVATINVTAYNADDNTANNATIRAYLVDEDGYELEGYVAATCKVTAVAQPEVRGTLRADTTSYTLPVGGIYDIQFSVTGVDATPVVTDSRTGSVFQLTNLGGNKYRVTGVNEGTAYVVATVGDTRVSVAITVDNDATQGGEKGNNVSEIR